MKLQELSKFESTENKATTSKGTADSLRSLIVRIMVDKFNNRGGERAKNKIILEL